MLAHEQHSISERKLLVGPLLDGFIESGTRQEHRPRSCDNPADMQRVPVPQFHAKVHVGDIVQVRVLKLPQQLVHALIETVVCPPNEVRFGAQAL
jgi:hypothetical protein